MDTLPAEILHQIFLLLPISQKQECMYVSKQWANLIRSRSLFQTIRMPSILHSSGKNAKMIYQKLMKMFDQHPDLRLQVEYMYLGQGMGDSYDRRKIMVLFPNLKVLQADRVSLSTREEIYPNQESFYPAIMGNQLEQLLDSDTCELTRLLVGANSCSHLTVLDIHLDMFDQEIYSVITLLKEMPVLKKLVISHGNLSVVQYDTLHADLPSLTELQLVCCELVGPFPSGTILPAPSLTSLRIILMSYEEPYLIDLPRYISRKYPNLKHLEYEEDDLDEAKMNTLYGVGYPLMLEQVGRQLQVLHLAATDHNVFIFKSLDRFGCRIKELTVNRPSEKGLIALGNSDQVKCIETLTLQDMVEFKYPSIFSKMEVLKSLNLLFGELEPDFDMLGLEDVECVERVEISLNDILQAKSLKFLVLQAASINYSHQTGQTYHLKELVLDGNNLGFRIDELVTECFPELTVLKVGDGMKPCGQYRFPNHHFSEIELYGGDVAIETLNDKKTRFFSTGNIKSQPGYMVLSNELVPLSRQDMDEDHLITIVCGSIKSLHIDGRIACL